MPHFYNALRRLQLRLWMLTTSAVTVLAAGCGGGAGPQSPPPTATPTAIPTATPLPTATPSGPPIVGNLIVTDGNSLTDGAFSTYPNQLLSDLGDGWTLRNFGVSGQITAQMTNDAKVQIDPLRRPGQTDILVAWEISNDLKRGALAADAYSRFQDYCQARRRAGWKVVAVTVLPRVLNDPKFEAARSSINADMRLKWRAFADALADVAGDPRIGNFGDQLDTTYYADGTHLTSQGYGIVATIVAAQVRRLAPAAPQS